jgi:hypothetical protein
MAEVIFTVAVSLTAWPSQHQEIEFETASH